MAICPMAMMGVDVLVGVKVGVSVGVWVGVGVGVGVRVGRGRAVGGGGGVAVQAAAPQSAAMIGRLKQEKMITPTTTASQILPVLKRGFIPKP